MEKVKAIILCIILSFGVLFSRSTPSFAMEYTFDPSVIGSIADLSYGLLGGATFDFDNSKYKIPDFDSLTEYEKNEASIGKVNEFLQDYYNARKEYIKSNVGFTQNVYSIYDIYSLHDANLINYTDYGFPVNGQLISDWINYDKYWYRYYQNSLTSEPDIVQPEPDPNYASLIEKCNGSGWYFKNYANPSTSGRYISEVPAGINAYSWCSTGNNIVIANTDANCLMLPLLTVNLNQVNGSYSWSYTIQNVYGGTVKDSNGNLIRNVARFTFYNSNNRSDFYSDFGGQSSFTYSVSGDLNTCLTYICNRFRNITIYVDGNLWAVAGNPDVLNPVIPDFPDVIGTSDDPIGTFDIPDNAKGEAYFDVTAILDVIQEAIKGASDTDPTTPSIITKDAIIDTLEDEDGEHVDTRPVPVIKIIDMSIEGEATDRLPNIEPPPDLIHDGFTGTSLLADVVLATQQVLPLDIITVFWGIVVVLIFIALLKSMHR